MRRSNKSLLSYWKGEKENAFFYKNYKRMAYCDRKINYYSTLRNFNKKREC